MDWLVWLPIATLTYWILGGIWIRLRSKGTNAARAMRQMPPRDLPAGSLFLRYQDSEGLLTSRGISDWRSDGDFMINAFCHLRQDRRSFRLDRMIELINSDTGELENPYKLFKMQDDGDGRPVVENLLWGALPAIKALKFFSATTRGLSARERKKLVTFMRSLHPCSLYSDDELDDWIKALCYGDLYSYRKGNHQEYRTLLDLIPATLRRQCHEQALLIARGSGRKAIDPSWLSRINVEFSE